MIAVWGANGFIGRYIVNEFINDGIDTLALARGFEGSSLSRSVKKVEADFCEIDSYWQELEACDKIIFLVTQSLSRTFKNIEQEIAGNVMPYCTVFDTLKRQAKKPHVIYMSSGGSIYGESHGGAIPEDHPLNPVSVYGQGKKMIERALVTASNEGGFPYTIIRPSNPVGAGGRNLISYALQAVLRDEEFTVYGDGTAIRDYFDVRDLARAMSLICKRHEAHHKIYNLGSGRGVSINSVLEMVENITGRKINKRFVDAPNGDVTYNVLNCGKARDELGWSAEKPLEITIANMWKELCEY